MAAAPPERRIGARDQGNRSVGADPISVPAEPAQEAQQALRLRRSGTACDEFGSLTPRSSPEEVYASIPAASSPEQANDGLDVGDTTVGGHGQGFVER